MNATMDRDARRALLFVILTGALIAAVSARPYAGSWNDGSRLATVESLVDHGTFVIDDSIFVKAPVSPSPYQLGDSLLHEHGTQDKLFIDGHFYSDKSPVPALAMAAIYGVYRALGGPVAAERPDWFCWLLTVTTSGLAYLIAVGCLFWIGNRMGLSLAWSLGLTGFFAVGTLALPYAQHVNNHILLLAVASLVFALLLSESRDASRWVMIGTLLGIAYTIDLAAGPVLVLAASGLLAFRSGWRGFLMAMSAALPWFLLHHFVNYSIGGTFGPANAVPEYLAWPGSPFHSANMTGSWAHSSVLKAVIYSLDMLFGKKGFIGHSLLLLLPIVLLPYLIGASYSEKPVILAGLFWGIGTWLLYASTSTNQSGGCCSIRWFVPLLVPAFIALAVLIRNCPDRLVDVLILGSGSTLLACAMAVVGPWHMKLVPGYWTVIAGTLISWTIYRLRATDVAFMRPALAGHGRHTAR